MEAEIILIAPEYEIFFNMTSEVHSTNIAEQVRSIMTKGFQNGSETYALIWYKSMHKVSARN